MANTLRRDEMITALTEAGITFEPEATVAQLRPLFDEMVADAARANAARANEVGQSGGQTVPSGNPQPTNVPSANQPPRNENAEGGDAETAMLDRQLELLRKKREVMELQRELQQFDQRRFDFVAFEAMVSPFTGDDSYDVNK